MKCDQLTGKYSDIIGPYYGYSEVNEAIEELKAENERLKKAIKDYGGKAHGIFKDAAEMVDKVSELKAKLESVQATAYADSVDAGMRERRLCRALWLARSYRAEARKNYWYARSCHEGDERLWSIDGSAVKYIGCIKRTNFDWLKIWSEVESKCLKKTDFYL